LNHQSCCVLHFLLGLKFLCSMIKAHHF
jgi:hypothetical protein